MRDSGLGGTVLPGNGNRRPHHSWKVTGTRASGQWTGDWLADESARPACGAPGCKRMGSFWRRTGRPVFEGRWACGRSCLMKLVEAAIWQELGDADVSHVGVMHRHRVPLGLVLLAQGAITQMELQRALTAQKTVGRGRIGEWLVKVCDVPERKVTKALSVQWNCPVLAMAGFTPRSMALVMPKVIREQLNVLPLRVAAGKILYVAAEERVDAAAAFALECMTGLTVESGVMPHAEFTDGVATLERYEGVACQTLHCKDSGVVAEQVAAAILRAQPVASRLVRLHESVWLRMWLERATIGKQGMLPTTDEDVLDRLFRVEGQILSPVLQRTGGER